MKENTSRSDIKQINHDRIDSFKDELLDLCEKHNIRLTSFFDPSMDEAGIDVIDDTTDRVLGYFSDDLEEIYVMDE